MAASSRDIQLSELKDMISDLNLTIKTLNHTIARQQSENDNLKAELAWFRQKLFGSSSERRMEDVAGQLNLFGTLLEEENPVELIEPEVVELPKKPRKKKPTLDKQFEGIPTRQVITDTLSDEDKICPLCGSEMLAIGTEVIRSEIVYTPPKLELNAVFGSIRLIVPSHWQLKMENNAVLGGVEDKRPQHSIYSDKIMYLEANAVFGGIQIMTV